MSLVKVYGFGIAALLALTTASNTQAYERAHAEVSVGFPNGQVTVGKTWGNGNREVIHETVVERERVYREPDEDREVIVERRPERCEPRNERVIIVEKHGHHGHDRVTVVKKYYNEDNCGRVVYQEPHRTVLIVPPGHARHFAYESNRYHGWHHDDYDRDRD